MINRPIGLDEIDRAMTDNTPRPSEHSEPMAVASDLTAEGRRLVDCWINTQRGLERAKAALNRAECDLQNAQNALARWMLPEDARTGEKIAIWHGDSLIQVEVIGLGSDPCVTLRLRGKRWGMT